MESEQRTFIDDQGNDQITPACVRASLANSLLRAHIVVDQRARIWTSDEEAEVLLGTPGSELTIRDGFLNARSAQWQARLNELLATPSAGATRVRTTTSPQGRLCVEVRALNRKPQNSSAAALSLIVVKTTTLATDLSQFAAKYSLSETEAQIMKHLCSGRRLSEYALTRGRSIHTVRTQQKGILLKLGVHSQIEAVGLMYQTYLDAGFAA